MSNRLSISSTETYSKNPSDNYMWYQRYMRFHVPSTMNTLNPACMRCKGSGWVLVQIGEDDVDKDICSCADEIITIE